MKKTVGVTNIVPYQGREIQVDAQLAEEMEERARALGGGWRIEHGVAPIITLTTDKADKIIARLKEAES